MKETLSVGFPIGGGQHSNREKTNTSSNSGYLNQPTTLNSNNYSLMGTKQLISPHAIASKYQSISTKNEEIKSKVKHFDFTQLLIGGNSNGGGVGGATTTMNIGNNAPKNNL